MNAQSQPRVAIDVSSLPTVGFGHRPLSWWALMGFIAVEGTTLLVLITSYLYLRMNTPVWPAPPAPNPHLLIPAINLVVILLAVIPAWFLDQAARRLDRKAVIKWLLVTSIVSALVLVLRWFEFESLQVKWSTNAYGSAAWAILVAHTLLVLTDFLESLVLAVFFITGWWKPTFFSDASDSAVYQYFLSTSWVVAFAIVFLGPWWL